MHLPGGIRAMHALDIIQQLYIIERNCTLEHLSTSKRTQVRQEQSLPILKLMGEWLTANGETIYGTRGGPLSARDWGVTTQKGNKVYIHILDWQDESLIIPSWGKKIKSAKLFKDKSAVKVTENAEFGITLKIPQAKLDEIDTIVELELK